jgi:RNA polymerase sigma-70 factor (ECF subfamily)
VQLERTFPSRCDVEVGIVDPDALASRLSRISTIWTLLADARHESESVERDAHLALIQRYQGAVYRYLLGALRDPDAADDLFQEFAVRCLKGAFARADPGRGRFRDYLKTTLIHLVSDYRQRKARRMPQLDTGIQPAAPVQDAAETDAQFVAGWRDTILEHAWTALSAAEQQGGQPYYSVLKFRAEHPDATSPEMASCLTEQLHRQPPFTETSVRKTLQRARAQFADLVVGEVERSLDHPTLDEVEQELIELGLLDYCRSAVARRRGTASDYPRS